MKNLRAAIAASLFAAALAACSEPPTGPRLDAPAGRAHNGGLGYGSGNVVPTDTTTNTTAADPTGTTATEPADSTARERGGMGYGSGN
jgi:hypothetical protein